MVIPHNTVQARFEGNRNKDRPKQRLIDNINQNLTSLGLTLRGSNWLDKWHQKEVISSYPLPTKRGHFFVPIAMKRRSFLQVNCHQKEVISSYPLPSKLKRLASRIDDGE